MPLFRVTFTMRGATATPWQADTIFGHLCWALRRREGETALADFLQFYTAGMTPIIVSDGFPGNLLPRPLMPATPGANDGETLGERRARARLAKEVGRQPYLSVDEFERALRGEAFVPAPKRVPTERITLKNQIDRTVNSTGGSDGAGHLYEFAETFWERVTIYVRTEDVDSNWVRGLFAEVAASGYGKRKSVGYGQIEEFAWEPFSGFEAPPEPNGFVTLSGFVPAKGDPTRGFWRTVVKYGKLGEELAVAGNPFKRPLLMLAAGSCFYDAPIRSVYGRLVDGVSPAHLEVVQYGLAFVVPARLPDRGA